MKTHYVKDLEQARLLTDPFKLKLLEQFAAEPRTTKQVADHLGEKAPKLYRHVDALATAGLLALVEERPKRGTIERYYQTVAHRFELEPQVLSAAGRKQKDGSGLIQKMFRETAKDLVRLAEGAASESKQQQPLIAKVSISASPKQLDRLRRKLEKWIEECEAQSNTKPGKNEESASVTALLAFYPSEQ